MTMPVPQPDVDPDVEPAAAQGADHDEAAEREAAEARARLRRGRLITAAVAAGLVVVVGVVALLGGLERRTDLITPVAVGSVITTGPFEITIASGTVQHRTGDGLWEVRLVGTARTTGSASISPSSAVDDFVFTKDGRTGEVLDPYSVRLGEPDQLFRLDNLTPGLPPVPWTVVFRSPQEPTSPLTVVVLDLEYGTRYIFGDEEGWEAQASGRRFDLALSPLPDTEY